MRPKGKLFALLAVFAAIGLVTATGAFTTVTAERQAEVTVEGDSGALLQITENDNSATGDYVQTNNGQIVVQLEDINPFATTSIEKAITITNNGNQEVAVNITKEGPNSGAVAFGVQYEELDTAQGERPSPEALTWYETNDDPLYRIDNTADLDQARPIDIEPGETVNIGIYIDTSDGVVSDGLADDPGSGTGLGPNTEIINDIVIEANADNVDDTDPSDGGNYDAA